MPKPSFPGPYINDTKIEDPIMRRVDVNGGLEIGARPGSGMPKDITNRNTIQHVGGTAGSKD